MRVDKSDSGFNCVREFALSGDSQRIVMLRAPDKQDAIFSAHELVYRQVNLSDTGNVNAQCISIF